MEKKTGYDAVVFDMDGVIFDSERAVMQCWKELADKYQIPDIEKAVLSCTGTTMKRTREIMLEIYGEDFPYDIYAKESSAIYHSRYDGGRLPMKPGVVELLTFLKEDGKKIALASSTRRQTVTNQLKDAGILDFFDKVICGDMVEHSKPAPDIFLKACAELGVADTLYRVTRNGYVLTEKTRIAKEQAEAELKAVKGELRTEKLKNSTAEVGTTILDGIGSRIGTSKVKRQQQQIDDLTQKNERLHSEIRRLNKTIDRERREHEQTAKRLQGEIDRIYGWFPDTPQLIRRGEYCREIGFTDKMACDLVNMLPVHFSGKLYSSEHSQHFENEHSEARLLRDEKGPGGFQLVIDLIPILQWFRQKAEEFLERLGIEIKDREQGRGMWMR